MARTTGLIILSLAMIGFATQADAQGRWDRLNRNEIARAQGVPPGQMPPDNLCRVWYNNRPVGRQPSAMDCRRAEAIVSRDRDARVIYGEDAYAYRYGGTGVYRDQRYDSRGYDPRGDDQRGEYGRGWSNNPAYETGFRDGLEKGRDDASHRRSFDVNRQSWYRSADRGYDGRFGSRNEYERLYRDAFEQGYARGYRDYRR